MFGIGTMEAEVDERRGRREDAGQLGAAHHAVGHPAALEQAEHLVVVPAGMAELHGHAHPGGKEVQEVDEPGVVADVVGPELDEKHRPLVAELVPACRHALHPGLGRIQPLGVRQAAGRLHRQGEVVRQPPAPRLERRRPRPAIEAAVELHRAEALHVVPEPLVRGCARRIQDVFPVGVAPAGRADVDGQRRVGAPGADVGAVGCVVQLAPGMRDIVTRASIASARQQVGRSPALPAATGQTRIAPDRH